MGPAGNGGIAQPARDDYDAGARPPPPSAMSLEPAPALVDPCQSPEQLVRLMRAGDMEALDRITRCYGQTLATVGRRYCRSAIEAEDAVQDALVAAGQNLRSYRGEGSPEGWLVRMVINACRKMHRGQKNAPALHDALDEAAPLPAAGANPEDVAARAQVAQALATALADLAPDDRALILLAEAEEWTAAEIADQLGSTPGAVRTRLSRIRARLRPMLEAGIARGTYVP